MQRRRADGGRPLYVRCSRDSQYGRKNGLTASPYAYPPATPASVSKRASGEQSGCSKSERTRLGTREQSPQVLDSPRLGRCVFAISGPNGSHSSSTTNARWRRGKQDPREATRGAVLRDPPCPPPAELLGRDRDDGALAERLEGPSHQRASEFLGEPDEKSSPAVARGGQVRVESPQDSGTNFAMNPPLDARPFRSRSDESRAEASPPPTAH